MNSASDIEKLRSRKHTLEDLIAGIVYGRKRGTPQTRQLLQGYKNELEEVRAAIAEAVGRAL